ncbi:MAG: DUF2007 domain-containing protein [Alphaproteobacteria bacterium]|nr:DUF2007 domain-containing protein [Alphaproteobacteria bacterium]MBV9372686.1 DUF2007 domain-containing protein [Alphaproteobacteria bacterium]MBV9901683.1 DUF2007 domain-containing protein [Alphaproteobacteria bacterium]
MALVEAAKFYNGFEAGIAQSRLTDLGIDSFIFDLETNWGGLDGVVPVRLMVDEEDLARARGCLSG